MHTFYHLHLDVNTSYSAITYVYYLCRCILNRQSVLAGLHSVSIFIVKVKEVDPSAPSTKASSIVSS